MNKQSIKAVWVPKDIDYATQIVILVQRTASCGMKLGKKSTKHLNRKINHTLPRGIRS